MKITQCRHVKASTAPVAKWLLYPLAGLTHAEASTELCSVCSGAVVALLEHLEADDDGEQYKRTLRDTLDAIREASTR